MKSFDVANIRNIALVSHGGAGKTSLIESIAFNAKRIDRIGKITDGNTVSDFEPEEIKRQISLNLSLIPIEWKNAKINYLDTPGYFDFVSEVKSALRVVEGCLILVDVIAGIQAGTEKVIAYSEEFNLPTALVFNKMDRENVEFDRVYESIQEQFGKKYLAVQIPYFVNKVFCGVIDVLKRKLITNDGEKEIPESDMKQANSMYTDVLENIVEADDQILEKYLAGEKISEDEFVLCLKKAIIQRKIFPILSASGTANIGCKNISDFIIDFFPSPLDVKIVKVKAGSNQENSDLSIDTKGPLAALIFKTLTDPYVGKISMVKVFSGSLSLAAPVYNVSQEKDEKVGQISTQFGKNQENVENIVAGDIGVLTKLMHTKTGDSLSSPDKKYSFSWIHLPTSNARMAIVAKNKNDEDKLSSVLPKIQEDDPSIKIYRDDDTKQTLINGMGETHLQVVAEKLKRKFGVSIDLIPPKLAYKETIRKTVKVEGKHKKQSGGHGQFGHCFLEVSPLTRGEKYLFENKIFGGSIPKNYIPAVEKGVIEAMQEGILAGFPVVDLRVTVFDGSYHPVDSSEIAFKIAGSLALKKALLEAESILLEPIMSLKISAPDAYMGSVIDDLNTKRGRVLGVEPINGWQIINAQAPLNELTRYITDISSITAARGFYEMAFSHYEEAPPKILKTVIEQVRLENEHKEG
jgi:elongation factor G